MLKGTNVGVPGKNNRDDPFDPETNYAIMRHVRPHFVDRLEEHRGYVGGHDFDDCTVPMEKYLETKGKPHSVHEALEAGGAKLVYQPNWRELPPLSVMRLGNYKFKEAAIKKLNC